MSKASIEIGRRIKAARNAAKMSQTELANRINKTLRTVQKYESGEITPSIEMISQIAKILGVFASELIAYERQEIQINSLSDIIFILNEINKKAEIRFEIETKRVSRDGEWSCSIKFNGLSPEYPYNADLCQVLEQYGRRRHLLENYWATQEGFDDWLEARLSSYATQLLHDKEVEHISFEERIRRRDFLVNQRIEAQKKAALADSDKTEE